MPSLYCSHEATVANTLTVHTLFAVCRVLCYLSRAFIPCASSICLLHWCLGASSSVGEAFRLPSPSLCCRRSMGERCRGNPSEGAQRLNTFLGMTCNSKRTEFRKPLVSGEARSDQPLTVCWIFTSEVSASSELHERVLRRGRRLGVHHRLPKARFPYVHILVILDHADKSLRCGGR